MESSMEASQKIKPRITISSSNFTTKYLPKGKKSVNSKIYTIIYLLQHCLQYGDMDMSYGNNITVYQ